MKIAIMQPYLFSYIGYFQLVQSVDTFILYDDVNYINKGYINRNSILINGQANRFTLEVIGASQNKLINEIEVGTNKTKILKSIEMGYKKAPNFKPIFSLCEKILLNPEKNLAKFVGYSIQSIADYLECNAKFIYSSDIEKNNTLKAQDKILDICRCLSAQTYINAINGQTLYDKNIFREKNMQLFFLKPTIHEYRQFNVPFVPSLSIIDVLMFNSKENVFRMLSQYELI